MKDNEVIVTVDLIKPQETQLKLYNENKFTIESPEKYPSNSSQFNNLASKLKQVIKMKQIGLPKIRENLISESPESSSSQNPLIKTADKLIMELTMRNKVSESLYQRRSLELEKNSPIKIKEKKLQSARKTSSNVSIYARGMLWMTERKRKRQIQQDEEALKEEYKMAFTPNIDKRSMILTKSTPKLHHRASEYLQMIESKKLMMKNELMKQFKKKHPFRPMINSQQGLL